MFKGLTNLHVGLYVHMIIASVRRHVVFEPGSECVESQVHTTVLSTDSES